MSKTGDARDKKRLENMGKLQNAIVENINNAKLPQQDLYMILTVLLRQVEKSFMQGIGL